MQDGVGYIPLRHAVCFQHVDFVRWLIEQGSDVNRRDNWTETILFWSIKGNGNRRQKREIVQLLLSAGADPNLSGFDNHFASGTALDRILRKKRTLEKQQEQQKQQEKERQSTNEEVAAEMAELTGLVADLRDAGAMTIGE